MATYPGTSYLRSTAEMQQELLPGESLLWSGQPLRRVIFHKQDWFSIPFSFMWGGFTIFWELAATGNIGSMAKHHPAPAFFALWGIPFVIMGQYMIWGRFIYTAWKKGLTHYGLTNKRVLVLNCGMSRKVTDGFLRNLDSVTLTTRPDGIGTIEFSPQSIIQSNFPALGRRGRGTQIDIDLSSLKFFDISDARKVYEMIQQNRDHAWQTDSLSLKARS